MTERNRLFLISFLSMFSLNLVASHTDKAAEAVRRIQERSQAARKMVNKTIAEARYGADQETIEASTIITRAWLANLPALVPNSLVVRSEESVRRIQERSQMAREVINEMLSMARIQNHALAEGLEDFQAKQAEMFYNSNRKG